MITAWSLARQRQWGALRQVLWTLPRWRWRQRRRSRNTVADVAVIIPVRNGADTLAETLRSLQAQDFPGWQAVVVDDGSTDGTSQVIAEFVRADRRISTLTLTGEGVSNARNRGAAASNAPWLVFLDADDWLAPDFLAHMLAAVTAHPAAKVAYSGSLRVLPDGGTLAELPGEGMTFPRELACAPFSLLADYCPLAIHSVLLSRQAFNDSGGFDVTLSTSEDWDLWLRVARTGAAFIGVPLPLAFYRLQAGAPRRCQERIARDAQQIIFQARRPDARVVRPDAQFVAGARNDDVVVASAGVTLYFAGVTAGSGLSPAAVLAIQQRWPDFSDDATASAAARDIEAGLAVGARLSHDALAANWHSFATTLDEILAIVEQHGSRAGAGRRCLEILEEKVLRASRSRESRALRTLHSFSISLDEPALVAPAEHVDRVWLRIEAGERVIDEYSAAASLSLAPRDVARWLLVRWGAGVYIDEPLFAASWRAAWQVARDRFARGPRPGRAINALATARRVPALLALARLTTDEVRAEDARRAEMLVARWRGASAASNGASREASPTPTPAAADTGRTSVPVLMYHSVAEHGPAALAQWRLHPSRLEEQLRYLREHDYYSVTSVDLLHMLRTGRPLSGKPIVLSFDDGYTDFARNAWPLLRRYDFKPEMFLVTDRVGGSADWDTKYGPPAPLMDWRDIRHLQSEGVVFGSHLATHRRAPRLCLDELLEEAARSRFTLEERLECAVTSIAMPFGIYDRRLLAALEWSGYEIGYTTEDGVAAVGMNPLALPRIEVMGQDPLAKFAARLECA